MSMAIKYQMMKKNRMEDGGEVKKPVVPGDKKVADSFRKAFNFSDGGYCAEGCDVDHEHMYAGGGHVKKSHKEKPQDHDEKEALKQYREKKISHEQLENFYQDKVNKHLGPKGPGHENYAEGGDVDHFEEMDYPDDDMIGEIMEKRKMMSEGGRVSNDVGTGQEADKLPNQFDDLVLRDDLEQHYTGANSGDELGNEQEDEDRRDIVSMIMKSRKKKDRLPHPM